MCNSSQLVQYLLGFLGLASFVIMLWKNPKLPYKLLLISIAVFILSFEYYNSRPLNNRLLPVPEEYILLNEEEKKPYLNWEKRIYTYGTDMSLEEVRDYYRGWVNKKSFINLVAQNIPGGGFINFRQL